MIRLTSPQLVLPPTELPDLAPAIFRQRMVIEGLVDTSISAEDIADYLSALSHELDMVRVAGPFTSRSDQFGWAGWIHWETSGAHFYAWDTPEKFFSVDIYTCKRFDPKRALDFTAERFSTSQCVGHVY